MNPNAILGLCGKERDIMFVLFGRSDGWMELKEVKVAGNVEEDGAHIYLMVEGTF